MWLLLVFKMFFFFFLIIPSFICMMACYHFSSCCPALSTRQFDYLLIEVAPVGTHSHLKRSMQQHFSTLIFLAVSPPLLFMFLTQISFKSYIFHTDRHMYPSIHSISLTSRISAMTHYIAFCKYKSIVCWFQYFYIRLKWYWSLPENGAWENIGLLGFLGVLLNLIIILWLR